MPFVVKFHVRAREAAPPGGAGMVEMFDRSKPCGASGFRPLLSSQPPTGAESLVAADLLSTIAFSGADGKAKQT